MVAPWRCAALSLLLMATPLAHAASPAPTPKSSPAPAPKGSPAPKPSPAPAATAHVPVPIKSALPGPECVPFQPPSGTSLGALLASYDSMTDAQLQAMWDKLPIPTPNTPFPLRGCTYGWVPGDGIGADVARIPDADMGWSGKCFSGQVKNGVPVSLTNAFSIDYENTTLAQGFRVAGLTSGMADVYYDPDGMADGKPVWTFNYDVANGIFDPFIGVDVLVNGVRDEVRQMAPGAVLGRMFDIPEPDGTNADGVALPIWFMLFQSCTNKGKVPLVPEMRQQLPLGL